MGLPIVEIGIAIHSEKQALQSRNMVLGLQALGGLTMIDVMQTRGQRIRQAIELRQIGKMLSLAAEIGVDDSAVSKWMNSGAISTHNVTKLCSALDVSADWLLLARGNAESHKARQFSAEELVLLERLERFDSAVVRSLTLFLSHLR